MTRILFATDFHGSNLVFRKFLSAAKLYKADVLVVGGDITGKKVVPVIRKPDGIYEATIFDSTDRARNQEELKSLEKRIGDVGFYAYHMDEKEHEDLAKDKEKQDRIFNDLILRRIEEWMVLAEEHLKGANIRCFIMAGNDDTIDVDSVIDGSSVVVNPDGKIVQIDDDHEMIGVGNANITPWNCPRDIPEEELGRKIDSLAANLRNPGSSIFCLHCPPYNTKLDIAPKLDEKLNIIHAGGQVVMIPVGSTAVRAAIEKYQPLLGLHGHIHESRGFEKIGRTLCLNAGSEYAEGIFRGAIINVDEKGFRGYMFVSG